MRVTVAIPAYNEANTIGRLVQVALEVVDNVVVADDGSTDATALLARAAGAVVVKVPHDRPGMVGVYVCALRAALDLTAADVVVEMDAGGSHDPVDLPRFVEVMDTADDVALVAGRRFGPGATFSDRLSRRLLSWCGTMLVNLRWLNEPWSMWWSDATSGFIAYRREALERLLAKPYRSSGHFYQSEVRIRAARMRMRMLEVPISFRGGRSSLRVGAVCEALKLLWVVGR